MRVRVSLCLCVFFLLRQATAELAAVRSAMQNQLSRMSHQKTSTDAALASCQAEVAQLQASCTQAEAHADALRTALDEEQEVRRTSERHVQRLQRYSASGSFH